MGFRKTVQTPYDLIYFTNQRTEVRTALSIVMAQTEEYRRNDGRGATTMRKLGIEIGGLSKSDGSARFGFGELDNW